MYPYDQCILHPLVSNRRNKLLWYTENQIKNISKFVLSDQAERGLALEVEGRAAAHVRTCLLRDAAQGRYDQRVYRQEALRSRSRVHTLDELEDVDLVTVCDFLHTVRPLIIPRNLNLRVPHIEEILNCSI
jgi:hypothetical protein